MRGRNKISHRPYIPANRTEDARRPFVCRIAPFETGFTFEWLDSFCAGTHRFCYGKRGEAVTRCSLKTRVATVEGLLPDTDYAFWVESEAGYCSPVRLVRTGAVPAGATVINYLHPEDKQYSFSGRYLCSPSLARLDNGRLIAGMDVYGNQMAQTLTLLFYSDDDGKSWNYLTDLHPFYWGTLFTHRGKLYILGLSTEYGNLQIACSEDGGTTWGVPTVILYGANVLCDNGGAHRAPMHLVAHDGVLYTTCEYGSWGSGSHRPAVLSVNADDDLMVAENWRCTGFLPFAGKWAEEAGTQGDTMEGNIVITPSGEIVNLLRWKIGSYLRLKFDPKNPEALLQYDRIVPAPVSNSMFRIFPYAGHYWMVTNRKTALAARVECGSYRNVLSLFASDDLENWTFLRDIINAENECANDFGFQYPAFLAEDCGVSLVIRSAFNHADNFHNSNYSLFYRIPADAE